MRNLVQFGLEKSGKVLVPVHPASAEQIAHNVARWRREQALKAKKSLMKKVVTAKVTDGHATIGQVVVAHLLKEIGK